MNCLLEWSLSSILSLIDLWGLESYQTGTFLLFTLKKYNRRSNTFCGITLNLVTAYWPAWTNDYNGICDIRSMKLRIIKPKIVIQNLKRKNFLSIYLFSFCYTFFSFLIFNIRNIGFKKKPRSLVTAWKIWLTIVGLLRKCSSHNSSTTLVNVLYEYPLTKWVNNPTSKISLNPMSRRQYRIHSTKICTQTSFGNLGKLNVFVISIGKR